MAFIYNPPLQPYLDIIYQDDDILVCNKPSGLLSVRGKAEEHKDSLEARAQRVWPSLGIVHRLDMSTSGIMLMALNKPAHSSLARQFQNRETQKTYIAEVWGKPAAKQGIIELPLICDWPNRPKQMVCFDRGKASTTYWRLLSNSENTSRLELTPITGRSHQLRVHMLHLGHPIIGDKFYAHPDAFAAAPRLSLHAQFLSFKHPVSDEVMSFTSPCPF